MPLRWDPAGFASSFINCGEEGQGRGNPGPGNGGKWRGRPGRSKWTVPEGQLSAGTQRLGPTPPEQESENTTLPRKGRPAPASVRAVANSPPRASRSQRERLDGALIPPRLLPLDQGGCAPIGPWRCGVPGKRGSPCNCDLPSLRKCHFRTLLPGLKASFLILQPGSRLQRAEARC